MYYFPKNRVSTVNDRSKRRIVSKKFDSKIELSVVRGYFYVHRIVLVFICVKISWIDNCFRTPK